MYLTEEGMPQCAGMETMSRLAKPVERIGISLFSWTTQDSEDRARDLQSSFPCQLFHWYLHLCLQNSHRQQHPHQQLLRSDDLELVIGLALHPLLTTLHGALCLKKSIVNANSNRARAKTAAFVLKFQRKAVSPAMPSGRSNGVECGGQRTQYPSQPS